MGLRLPWRRERSGRAAVAALVAHIPRFLQLLYRLIRDPRVSRFDKVLVLGAVGYVLTPTDLLPDFLGFMGLVDDLYLLALVLDRLLLRAGRSVLDEHWEGDPHVLGLLVEGLDELGALVPAPVRALLRGRVPDE